MGESSKKRPPKIPQWLHSLPLAPIYHPTLAEFQDPISYIYTIEKEASQYGICKIVPPLSQASKTTAINNFNRSIDPKTPVPTFTTQLQHIGLKESVPEQTGGDRCTFKLFKAKAKEFEDTHLRKCGLKKDFIPLDIETIFWKACAGDKHIHKPFSVECVNGVPGSAFVPINEKKLREAEATTVGETPWNMRGVSRAKGSLLRFMEQEIAGMCSPMVGLAMLFSWVGWHVEDHELHSLNYIHMGASKTWYTVPKEAAAAFEEVVRVHEYGGRVNPLVTCATLAEKTTIISPEVLIGAGVPCCRLVQNAGEFVVTFPRAYHTGFSHGFNCAETTNIATPEWLKIAEEAAVRRASINYSPLVSHFQLLYTLALSLYSRLPLSINTEPRSSRLKEKKRGEGETMVKELFVRNVIQNNEFLHDLLEQGSSCVFLPQNSSNLIWPKINVGSKVKTNARFSRGIPSPEDEMGRYGRSVREGNRSPSFSYHQYGNADLCTSTSDIGNANTENEGATEGGGVLDHGMFSCVACGILTYACAAVIQPTEASAQYFMSGDRSFNDGIIASGTSNDDFVSELDSCSGREKKNDYDEALKGISSLDLLAAAYGSPSDSDDEKVESEMNESSDENNTSYNERDNSGHAHEAFSSESNSACGNTIFHSVKPGHCDENAESMSHSLSVGGGEESSRERLECGASDVSVKSATFYAMRACSSSSFDAMTKCSNLNISRDTKIPFKQRCGEGSSKNHIFCLEHAVEVEKQLQTIGGVHVLLVCHPDYPRVETVAKALAEELEIDYLWKDISFKKASEDDQERIQSALDVEEAVFRNEDWTVKLGINLSHSALFSQSPLYMKQMPPNSIVCKAFGYSSPTDSSMEAKFTGKNPGKHNKIVVAGKWCGKVWMSNKVHPFLAQRTSEKEQPLISFHSQATTEPKVEIESGPDFSDHTEQSLVPRQISSQSLTTTVIKQYARKRKGTLEKVATKKPKYEDSSIEAEEDSPVESSPPHCGMTLRTRAKRQTTPLSNKKVKNIRQCDANVKQKEEAAIGRNTRLRKKPAKFLEEIEGKSNSKKQTTKKNTKTALPCNKYIPTKDEAEFLCDMDGCTMEFSSKQDLALHKRNICPVEGCGKKFLSHDYLGIHGRVHMDDRPYKCPWKGCKMTFKWAWARTEHIRVHTGARPYECQERGCGQTFRFVSDFSRHKRKTGHSVKKMVVAK